MRHVKARECASDTPPAVSERVIHTIADREGISPLDISPPLFDAIDPDALDRLYGDDRAGVTVGFEFAGYRVTVSGDGRVDLTPIAE